MKTKKWSHHLSAGPLAGTVLYYGKSGASYFYITFIKELDEGSGGFRGGIGEMHPPYQPKHKVHMHNIKH